MFTTYAEQFGTENAVHNQLNNFGFQNSLDEAKTLVDLYYRMF